jgi:hypothetical protein
MLQPDIQRQNAQLFDSINSNLGSGYVDTYSQFKPQAGAVDPAAAAGAAQMNQSRKDILANTSGRATALANDPLMKQATDFYSKVMAGGAGPYTDASKAAMLAQHGKATSDAQAAQMAALRDATAASGGSIYDPSFQAKSQELNANRQGSNIDAQGQIEADAAGANFNARMGGASGLVGARSGQNAQINQMSGMAANFLSNDTAAVPAGTAPQAVGGITTAAPRNPSFVRR